MGLKFTTSRSSHTLYLLSQPGAPTIKMFLKYLFFLPHSLYHINTDPSGMEPGEAAHTWAVSRAVVPAAKGPDSRPVLDDPERRADPWWLFPQTIPS